MKLFVPIYNDMTLLPHFLRHYRSIGVEKYFIALPPEYRADADRLVQNYDVTLLHELDVRDSLLTGSSAVTAMRHRYQNVDEWVVIVDLDEFIETSEALGHVADRADQAGATVVRGIMHDRFAASGQTAVIDCSGDLHVIFPIKSRFIRRVMGGFDHKGVLVKGRLKAAPNAGHHWFEDERVHSEALEISHFKWIDGAIDRLRASCRLVRDSGLSWSDEYQRALDHYNSRGRFAWEEFGGRPAAEFIDEPPRRCGRCSGIVSDAEADYSNRHFGRPYCRRHQTHWCGG